VKTRRPTVVVIGLMIIGFLVHGSMAFAAGQKEAPAGETQKAQKPITLRLAHISDTEHPSHKGALLFKKLVEERTNGLVKIEIFPNSSLGSAPEYTEQIKLGTVDLGLSTSGQLQVWVPNYGAVMIPFLFDDYEHAHRALDGKAGQLLADMALKENFVVLANWEWGFREITNSKLPITRPADIAKLKMRVPNEIQLQAMYETLGATTAVVAFPELYMALAQGVVDGQCNPVATIFFQKFYEVQDYMSVTNHVYNTQMLVMSDKVWNKLPAETQSILKDAAMEAGQKVRELTISSEEDLISQLEDKGMQVNYPDLEPFREKMGPAIDRIAEFSGREFTQQFIDLVDQVR
jgi:tripartite ATP-independent transporter DctP family solute receptor